MLKSTIAILVLFVLLSATSWAEGISVGKKVPDFQLTNPQGQKVALSDFKGKVVMITFLYTRCPYPDKCPMLETKLGQTRELMDKLDAADKFQVLSVTIDPAYDTPERLAAYSKGNDKAFPNWQFLTGSATEVAKVAGLFGVIYWEENGVIEHNMRTAIIAPDQKLAKLLRGTDWKAGQLAATLKEILPE